MPLYWPDLCFNVVILLLKTVFIINSFVLKLEIQASKLYCQNEPNKKRILKILVLYIKVFLQ